MPLFLEYPQQAGFRDSLAQPISRHGISVLLLTIPLLIFGVTSVASAQKSRSNVTAPPAGANAGKAATPTSGSKTTFTLTADQKYCDVSLPYSYSSTDSALTLNIGSQNNWSDTLQGAWNKIQGTAPVPPGIGVKFGVKITFPAGDRDDPPILDNKVVELNDNGTALLGDPKHELSTDTFDAQRLLVRTLFGPNPFQTACAYPYLKYPDASVPTAAQLQQDANGKQFNLFGQGSGSAFSLNDPASPQYFLIDIVRWKDATPPNGAPSTVPFFQPVSDDWYLLNYSDSKARPQDISKWFHRITPSLASDTLRIIGSSKVMFLAIHLAPVPINLKISPGPPNITATEQAWYDDVTIKYSIQATTYEPTQMQDLQDLFQILGSYISPTAAAAPAAHVPAVVPAAPPPPLDQYLRQSANMANPIVLSTYQGRYGAGLLTNLTALPVNLTDSWTATFSTSSTPAFNNSTSYNTTVSPAMGGPNPPPTPSSNSTPPCTVSLDTTDKANPKQADCNVTGAKVQNEGLARWDVSVVVPASSYSDVTFQASTTTGGTNSITSKTVSRTNAYGVFDIFLYPEDLVHPPNFGIPHLIVGLPFAGKVFDKPYFAVGETINLPNTLGKLKVFNWIPGVSSLVSKDLPLSLRPTFGWVYNKIFPTPGSSASYRSLKPQFGVEISISGLVKTLSKGSSTGTTSATKTGTGSTVPKTGS